MDADRLPMFNVDPPAIVRKVEKPKAVVVKRPAAATHSHVCGRCGTEFWHGDDSFGKAADHACPKCGYGPNWTIYRRASATFADPLCPTGT